MTKDSGPSRIAKAIVPLALVAIAAYQVIVNRGHVDDNVVGALVFIAVGGTAGYAIDRIIQNLYWARTTGGVDRHHPEGDEWEDEAPSLPHPGVYRARHRKRRPAPENETPDAITEEG